MGFIEETGAIQASVVDPPVKEKRVTLGIEPVQSR
jgi:hypothetical protein